MGSREIWTKDRPNILSHENIEKIKDTLTRGCIFGHHYYFYGGCSSSAWAYSDFTRFMNYVSNSKPGDIFVIWSVEQLIENNLLLARIKYNGNSKTVQDLIPEKQMQVINDYWENHKDEIIVVFKEPEKLDVKSYEKDDIADFSEDLQYVSQFNSEVFVFPEKEIDTKNYILVEAKYPNENGEVPIGGAY